MNEKTFAVATKSVIFDKDKILIMKKSKEEDVTPESYDIPGGRVEFGEKLEDSIKREVKEETGLDIEVIGTSRAWSFVVNDNLQLFGITFACKLVSGELKQSREHTEATWLSIPEALEIKNLPEWLKEEINSAKRFNNE